LSGWGINGNLRGRRANTEADFWTHVDRSAGPSACWPWMGARTKRGYGVFRFVGRQRRAAQLALEFTSGPLPNGHGALHTCDNPTCCNPGPGHVYSGTDAQNAHDRVVRGRGAKGATHGTRIHGTGFLPRGDEHHGRRTPEVVARGEDNGAAVLTEDDVRTILNRFASGESAHRLAKAFGVVKGTVQHILSGTTWAHVSRPDMSARPSRRMSALHNDCPS
jgi:hypothetical protein